MKCFAFISYSRNDSKTAHWLHKKLEKYPYPHDLVKDEHKPLHRKYIRKVFIDVKDLKVTEEEFTVDIMRRLEEARYLIVICTSSSAKSSFVRKEIMYFLQTHNNRTDLILPVIVDSADEKIPDILSDLDILKRNCPIYNSNLDENSEANLYCFYHVVSFLLKVEFTKLYNRYESYSKRKRRFKVVLILLFFLLSVFSSLFLFISLDRQKELTKFEKSIFPLSVVFGYEKNFLSPAIQYLKESNKEFGIYILMPYCVSDLKHQNRIAISGDLIKEKLNADSIYSEKLPTIMKRGTIIGRIADDQLEYDDVYIDFASTTSTFLQILNYKKERYPSLNEDKVIQDYSSTFIRQTNELLEEDSVYVHFYVSQEEFINGIKNRKQNK